MNLQQARDWSDLTLKVCSIVAILLGGIWAYFQFHVTGTTEKNIQLTVVAEVLPYAEGTRLLVVHAKPRNIGKVPVEMGKVGFLVSVRAIPADSKAGPIEITKIPVAYKTDILSRFSDGYRLEPGVEYDELFVVVVPTGLYVIDAVLNLDAQYEVDHAAVVQVR